MIGGAHRRGGIFRRMCPCVRPFRLRAIALGLAVALESLAASAAPLRVPGTDLTMDFSGSTPRACVVGTTQPRDPQACEGVDVPSLERMLGSAGGPGRVGAMLRFQRFDVVVNAIVLANTRLRSAEQIARFVDGMASGGSAAGHPTVAQGIAEAAVTHEVLRINGIDVVRARLDANVPPQSLEHETSSTLVYAFVGREQVIEVFYTTGPEHAAEVAIAAEGIARTASMPGAGIEGFGEATSRMPGGWRLAMYGVGALGIFVASYFLARGRGAASRGNK